jgi:hypothetical protein
MLSIIQRFGKHCICHPQGDIHIRPEDGNAMFALLDSTQHSTRLTPEIRSYTLNSSRENQPKGKNLQLPKRSETRSIMKTI